MENRKGILHLRYGQHTLRLTARDHPVELLGAFAYDTRSNRAAERVIRGAAVPGETVRFVPAFAARPFVFCTGGLRFVSADLKTDELKFSGTEPGQYEIVGEP